MSARVDFAYLRAVRSSEGPSTADARAVATLLALHADRGSCHLDRGEISAETKLGRRRVRNACADLIAEGWATEEHGPGKPRWTLSTPGSEVKTGQAESAEPVRLKSARGSKPVRLKVQNRSGSEVKTGQATPPGSTPKTTPGDLPQDPERARESSGAIPPEVRPAPGIQPGTQATLPGLEAPATKPHDPLQAAEVTEVLEHWRSRGYHTRRPIDSPERRKRIADRIAEGFDVATLKAAIDGASVDDYLRGRHERNDVSAGGRVYNGVETILRDAAQVEKLATLWDVALAEERVLPDGGTKHHDRFGEPRRKAPERPAPPPLPASAIPQTPAECEAKLAAMRAETRELRAREDREREALELARRAGLTAEQRAEEDFLRAAAERGQRRLAEQEARDERARGAMGLVH